MFTQEEKKMLLDLLNSVQVTGNRQTIPQTLEKLSALARKIEAMPTENAGTPEIRTMADALKAGPKKKQK